MSANAGFPGCVREWLPVMRLLCPSPRETPINWVRLMFERTDRTAESTERIAAIVAKSGVKPGETLLRERNSIVSAILGSVTLADRERKHERDAERETRTATITSVVGRERLYTVGRIAFQGIDGSATDTIGATSPLKKGELFDSKKLEMGLDRLSRTGYVGPLAAEDVDLKFNGSSRVVEVSVRMCRSRATAKLSERWPNRSGSTIAIAYSVFNLFGGQELISSHLKVVRIVCTWR